MESQGKRGRSPPSPATLHGFRVESYGKPLPRAVKRAFKRLSERGFDDAACVVVKTAAGPRSGGTHAGGRYVHPQNPSATDVIRELREAGLEPPPPPFVLAPGEFTLYHEWGHHVDRTWSRDDQEVLFSFRWFSRFYRIGSRRASRAAGAADQHDEEIVPIESELLAGAAALLWWRVNSELFANLFEDWMRGEKRVPWDHCEPESLNWPPAEGHPALTILLAPDVRPEDVRAGTYALFRDGIRSGIAPPPVRPDLLGVHTAEVLGRFREVMRAVHRERRSAPDRRGI